MTEQQQQNEPLYTLTIEMIHQKTSPKWLTIGAATDTLARLVEWAAPANPEITPPEAPLTTEAVRQFVAAVAAQPEYEWRVHVKPAPEGTRATLDELEDFAHRCENGTVTVEDMDRHDKLSTLYPPARVVSGARARRQGRTSTPPPPCRASRRRIVPVHPTPCSRTSLHPTHHP